MIYESYYWRKELLKLAQKIEKRIPYTKLWTESQHGAFEREVMIGCYMIRKLKDSVKLTNKILSTKIPGLKYQNKGTPVTLLNNHRFMEFYDFENVKMEKFNVIFLINQIIHSYIFSPKFDVNRDEAIKKIENENHLTIDTISAIIDSINLELSGVYFCSDDKRNEFLYELNIQDLIGLFRTVENCHVTSSSWIFNPDKRDYDVMQTDEVEPIPAEDLKYLKLVGKQLKEAKRKTKKS